MAGEKVIILAGGQGMRLREETEFRPKPMVMIGSKPILWHIMKGYHAQGFKDFVVCLGYRGESIKQYFRDYHLMSRDVTFDFARGGAVTLHESGDAGEHGGGSSGGNGDEDWRVTLADTGESAMTGARVKRVERHIVSDGGDTFLLTYGDGVANVDIQALLAFHRGHGRLGTVTGVFPQSRFGELVRSDSRVVEFNEKPLTHGGCINGGFFAFNRGFFDYLDRADGCTLEGPPLAKLAADGQLMVYEHRGFWQCMDTMRDLQLLRNLWAEGAPWKVW